MNTVTVYSILLTGHMVLSWFVSGKRTRMPVLPDGPGRVRLVNRLTHSTDIGAFCDILDGVMEERRAGTLNTQATGGPLNETHPRVTVRTMEIQEGSGIWKPANWVDIAFSPEFSGGRHEQFQNEINEARQLMRR